MKKCLSLLTAVALIAICGCSESNLRVKICLLADRPPIVINPPYKLSFLKSVIVRTTCYELSLHERII